MTDKELLELAAKAAGMKILGWLDGVPDVGCSRNIVWWNPLADDGDAMRLAVRLKIRVDWIDDGYAHISYDKRTSEIRDDGGYNIHSFDIYESSPGKGGEGYLVRRAIVRAAAEIGGNAL